MEETLCFLTDDTVVFLSNHIIVTSILSQLPWNRFFYRHLNILGCANSEVKVITNLVGTELVDIYLQYGSSIKLYTIITAITLV